MKKFSPVNLLDQKFLKPKLKVFVWLCLSAFFAYPNFLLAEKKTGEISGLEFIQKITDELKTCALAQKNEKNDLCKEALAEHIDFTSIAQATLQEHKKRFKLKEKQISAFAKKIKTLATRSLFPYLDQYEGQNAALKFENPKPLEIKVLVDTQAFQKKEEKATVQTELQKDTEVIFILKKLKKIQAKSKAGEKQPYQIVNLELNGENWIQNYQERFKEYFAESKEHNFDTLQKVLENKIQEASSKPAAAEKK